MIARINILLILIFFSQKGFSQKETYIWYFGDYAGIDFNSGQPKAIKKGKMKTYAGSASICSPNGKLLFYTNGLEVFDSTHTIMPNGKDLLITKGTQRALQSTIIIPNPGNKDIYYIFSNPSFYDIMGLRYSEVNMKLNNGKGDVVAGKKSIQLVNPTLDKLTAVRHSNGKDIWVITHERYSDAIYAYLVTKLGISNQPVLSSTGFKILELDEHAFGIGQMKISPDGKKIAYTNSGNFITDTSVIADFNNTTGKVSNVWLIPSMFGSGVEFSPNSQYVYFNKIEYFGNNYSFYAKIFQFNAKAESRAQFLDSKKSIDNSSNVRNSNSRPVSSLQLAPDGKIYIASYNHYLERDSLNVIHAPDSVGQNCRLQKNYLSLDGRIVDYGLPNFITSYFNKDFLVQSNCNSDTVHFVINSNMIADSVFWNFGDTARTKDNYSNKKEDVYYIYKKSGYYKIHLIFYANHKIDTVSHIYYHHKIVKPDLGKDTSICTNFRLKLYPKTDYKSYKWNTGSISKTIEVMSEGIYFLNVEDIYGCKSSDTIIISTANPVSDFTYILNGKNIELKANQANNMKYHWIIANSDSASETSVNYNFTLTKLSDMHSICLNVINSAGCFSETCKNLISLDNQNKILIYPNPNSGSFTIDVAEPKENLTIELFDQIGRLIYKEKNNNAIQFLRFNLSNGLYSVRVTNGEYILNQRIFVSK